MKQKFIYFFNIHPKQTAYFLRVKGKKTFSEISSSTEKKYQGERFGKENFFPKKSLNLIFLPRIEVSAPEK